MSANINRDVTHYADFDAVRLSKYAKRALCGLYIVEREHTNTPSCPDCKAALQAREDDDAPSLLRLVP